MAMPSLLVYAKEAEYRNHFEQSCCGAPVITHDGIAVNFEPRDFDHCCFSSSRRNGVKDTFCTVRAGRIDWIVAALQDPSLPLHIGWDSKRKQHDGKSRVAVVAPDYVVIIKLTKPTWARFVTAYVTDATTMAKIVDAPKWQRAGA